MRLFNSSFDNSGVLFPLSYNSMMRSQNELFCTSLAAAEQSKILKPLITKVFVLSPQHYACCKQSYGSDT